ncbi:MAG: translation elongation factor Ts [Candidatus Dadabacteria bacterium]|nr:translation elongation factor Ts [Candidatus Dadabacteria bacterium]NIS08820.1 translation elongation factor Ts [Candidatus Dadabacteria bacterium]NIY22170.1 translation elongation factor Ts [Candidatus Dadabacteria bacterium]
MAEISAQMVKEIRDATGAGFVDCKNALAETDGNAEKAIEILRIKGLAKASKKTGRATPEGTVTSYIHAGGKIGVLLEVNCETDFVARNDEFQEFTREVAMQIAAANPTYVTEEDVPEEVINKEREIMRAQVIEEGKPEKVADKIVDGKITKYLQENCLVNQIYIRDSKKKISDLLSDLIAKVGENIQIRRFERYQLGE